MREEYANSLQFSDGDIFRYLVDARRSQNADSLRRWSARLDKWPRKNYVRLKKYNEGKFMFAFEKLLPFAAQWSSFKFGMLDRIFSMHCYEVSKTICGGRQSVS